MSRQRKHEIQVCLDKAAELEIEHLSWLWVRDWGGAEIIKLECQCKADHAIELAYYYLNEALVLEREGIEC